MTEIFFTYCAQQDDDLCDARSLIALLRHTATDNEMSDDARQGLYLVAQQAAGILTVCIERARALRDEAPREGGLQG